MSPAGAQLLLPPDGAHHKRPCFGGVFCICAAGIGFLHSLASLCRITVFGARDRDDRRTGSILSAPPEAVRAPCFKVRRSSLLQAARPLGAACQRRRARATNDHAMHFAAHADVIVECVVKEPRVFPHDHRVRRWPCVHR